MITERHASPRLVAVALALALAALDARTVRGDLRLASSTYLGGTGDDADEPFNGSVSIAVDAAGNRYVAGSTTSADFPTTPGANRTFGGDVDIFVTKFSPSGAVVYSTYLGGPCEDYARGIAVDAAGNAYVTGRANGGVCWLDIKAGVLVAKLDPNGSLVYSSIFGGRLVDTSSGKAIAVDGEGHAYVTGVAVSDTRDFPTTPGALRTQACDNVYDFGGDGFVAKLSVDGGTLLYSTLLCGRGDDSPSGIGVDAAGNAYVAGSTASTDFPIVNAFQESFRGGSVAITGFVSKLDPDGSHLVYSSYFGGSANDAISGLAIDGSGNAYVTGETLSTDIPTTPGVLQPQAGNRFCPWQCTDAFVAKVGATGSLVYSTYLFGDLSEGGVAIAADGAGNAYVVGLTNSIYFPVRGAFQTLIRGEDAFVTKLDPAGARIVYSTLLGGNNGGSSPRTGWDQGTGIAIDAAGNAHVAGYTQSYDFPTTPGAVQPAIGNGVCDVFGTPCGDAFVATIAPDGPPAALPVTLTVAPAEVGRGGTLTAAWAGIPRPSADDHLRLYTLGSKDDYPGVIAAWWPTTSAAGALALTFPDTLAPGWYDLRLYSDDATYNLPEVVARSEPIFIGDGATVAGGGGPGTTAACGVAACDDGDTCTDDTCVPGAGCVSKPASGVASVVCTCGRPAPDACGALPAAIGRRRERACGFFADAAGAGRAQRKRLRKGMATLQGSIGVVVKARRKGKISSACAGALEAELHDAMDRAERVISTLGSPRR